ncbi:MAG TPA: hypothetical protein VFV67_35255 [Actinophytocola sp.]|nr:hypothetical protein [Actinophytocola sp.]HEU5475913.1 hypothetical protein [Actinophytocola sp.]
MDQAFQALRNYARSHNARLSDTAQHIVTGTLEPDQILTPSPRPAR